MRVCGVSIAAAEAIMVWFDSDSLVPISGAKVGLDDPYSQTDLLQLLDLIRQLLAENKTELLVVRKSSTSGKYPAGHSAFRLETLIAISATCDVMFVSSQEVAAFERRGAIEMPDALKKYQHDAYRAAITASGG